MLFLSCITGKVFDTSLKVELYYFYVLKHMGKKHLGKNMFPVSADNKTINE